MHGFANTRPLLSTPIAAAALAVGGSADAQVLLNEVLASTTGTDVEYVELIGSAGASLAGLSVVVVEGEANSNQGNYSFRVDLGAADALGDNGYFLIANARVTASYGVTPNLTIGDNALQNGSETIALLQTDSIVGNSVSGSEVAVDAVALTEGVANEPDAVFYFDAPVIGPDGDFFPAGARRAVDGVDTDAASDWLIADFNLGSANTPTAGDVPPPPVISLSIPEIQGSGAASGYQSQLVTTTGIVVGDFQASGLGTDGSVNGFYLQDVAGDADPATSDGVFVFDGFSPAVDVAPGDRVAVTGIVVEYFGETQISDVTSIEVVEPAAVERASLVRSVTLPTSSVVANADGEWIGDLEAYEGMLVHIGGELTVGEYFNLDRFGEIRLAVGPRLFQFTQQSAPDLAGYLAHVRDVAARTIMLDDGLTVQNPDPIRYPSPGLSTSNSIRGGDSVHGLTGVLRFSRGSGGSGDETYRLLPTEEPEFVSMNPRPPSPPGVGGEIRVAAFNVLNYFNTLDNGDEICGTPTAPQECRGADAAFGTEELDRQTEKLVTAMLAIDADVIGLVELENDYADGAESAIAALVAALNERAGSERYTWIDPDVPYVGSDAIAVGVIYRPDAVRMKPGTYPAVLTDAVLPSLDLADRLPVFEGPATSRSPMAVTFESQATGGAFTVVVNHFKSKGQSDLADPLNENFDQQDGQGFWSPRRVDAAEALIRWVKTDPTGSLDPDVVLLGDFNAYAQEEPVARILDAGYANVLATGPDALSVYGYLFDGQLGTLDYAFVSETLQPQARGAGSWAINADEPDGLDYNLDFGRPAGIFDGTVPFRSSDHDPILLGLDVFATGDFDGDGRLQPNRDFVRLLRALGSRAGERRFDAAVDLDLDGTISVLDALCWLHGYRDSLR